MCYHPNVVFWKKDAIYKTDGTKGKSTKIYYATDPRFKGYEYYLEKDKEYREQSKGLQTKGYKLIPCGKCIACRTQERYSWATRIELEAKQYENNYFLTLTYNNENLTIPEEITSKKTKITYFNDGTWTGTLVKKELQQFIKSLRQWFERDYDHEGMKFYACGEYGSAEYSSRPHYHIILLNCPELQLERIPHTTRFTNERINKIWHKGFTTIARANWDTISYTAGYCQKKLFGKLLDEKRYSKGQEPEFAVMSRRPGIARTWYEENKDKLYITDKIVNSKGKEVAIPQYFDRLQEKENPEKIEEVKQKRNEIAYNRTKLQGIVTDCCIKRRYQIQEQSAIQKFKKTRKKGNFINVQNSNQQSTSVYM